jgi:predicted nucleic acid-binding protein
MRQVIVLDSGPLGLLVQRPGVVPADECRGWIARHVAAGARIVVPEITDYELRRELLRLDKSAAIARLDRLEAAVPTRYLPLTTNAMRKAAELWADTRKAGIPTAAPKAIDVDVILAAQVLTSGIDLAEVILATSNPRHFLRFVPVEEWSRI